MKKMKTDKKKLLVFPNDPLIAYSKKGEIKPRYYNPCNYFDEVHIVTFIDKEVDPEKVQMLAGSAKLFLYPIGNLKRVLFSFRRTRKELLALARGIQPDIIRTFNPLFQGYFGTWLGKRLQVPVVTSLHGDYQEMRWLPFRYFGFMGVFRHWKGVFFKQTLFCIYSLLLERYVMRNADAVLCVSAFLKDYAKRKGARNIVVIYNRVDTEQFSPHERKKQPDELWRVLTVGRVGQQKNQMCVLEAIHGLPATLMIVGKENFPDGYATALKTRARVLGIQDKVTFIEALPHEQIPALYQQADIFAIATRWEGFCIPILEAMASGLPVVASDKEPLPEVGDGGGLFVDITPEAFREALRKIMDSSGLRKKLVKKGRERALALRGAIMERKEADLYASLLKEKAMKNSEK